MDAGIKGLLIGMICGLSLGGLIGGAAQSELNKMHTEAIRRNLATYDEHGKFVWKEKE